MTQKLEFYLLDVNTETIDHSTEIRLWVVNRKGKPVLLRHPRVPAHFYAMPKPSSTAESVASSIAGTKIAGVSKTEIVEKRFFGKPVQVVKVVSDQPELVSKIAHAVGELKNVERTVEDDIRVGPRYLIENGLVPCAWHVAETIPSSAKEVAIDVFELEKPPTLNESAEVPNLKMLAFSVIAVGAKGSARPEHDPIAILSAATSDEKTHSFVREGKDDSELLAKFQDFVREFDPDIIVGYTNNRLDWPYIIKRAEKLGFKLNLDRSGSGPHPSMYGHMSIAGRVNLDIYDLASDMIEIKVKTLENTAEFFGVTEFGKNEPIEEHEYQDYWAHESRRTKLIAWNEARARATLRLAELNLPFVTQLAALTGMPPDQVLTAAVGFRVDWYLIRQAHRVGELVPKRLDQPYFPYRGAIVLEPRTGLHDNVAVLDFASMYPNIMILRNLSPETIVRGKDSVAAKDVFEVKETKAKFRKKPEGFYAAVLRGLIEERVRIREQVERLDQKSLEYRILREREKAVKVITNACYGYAGWTGARWYVREVAESAAALGRGTINEVIAFARKIGLTVIYGDTDSIFVENAPAKIDRLLKMVEKELELEIKGDKVYTRTLFTEAKKRYAGLLPDGRLDIVGLEVVRGDWAEVAKNAQEAVIRFVLEDKSPDRAAHHVRRTIADLRAGRIPLRDLVIWKTLTKPVEEYKVHAPHVEAAKKLLKAGWELTSDEKIGYVITKGKGKLYEKAKPLALVGAKEVDVEYYETNQVLPASARILELLGVKERELLPENAKGA